jgi:protoheme IX farnesyltransferase
MLVARRGLPPARLALAMLAAGALAAASANALNCYIEQRASTAAQRIARRSQPGNGKPPVIRPAETLAFGIALGAAATILLGTLANWLSAVVADAAILLFVFVCTVRLTRRSPSGILIGGVAGCFPVLVGWSAITGALSPLAIVLLGVIFCWMPPRLWALAMESRSDAAALVTRPTIIGSVAADAGAGKILWYSCVMLAATLGLAPYGGWVYTTCAVALGSWFVAEAHRLRARARRLSGGASIALGKNAATPAVLPGLCAPGLAQLFAIVLSALLLSARR